MSKQIKDDRDYSYQKELHRLVLEVQPKNNLHFLVDEMVRWKDIIGNEYSTYKLRKLRQYL